MRNVMQKTRYASLLSLLLVTLSLAACTISPVTPTEGSTPAAAATSAPRSEAVSREAFPVTIEHKYGSTTINEFPERIVTVGLTDHDALIALGIVPVGTT